MDTTTIVRALPKEMVKLVHAHHMLSLIDRMTMNIDIIVYIWLGYLWYFAFHLAILMFIDKSQYPLCAGHE